jgi:hypothetical protein
MENSHSLGDRAVSRRHYQELGSLEIWLKQATHFARSTAEPRQKPSSCRTRGVFGSKPEKKIFAPARDR